ncbi:acyltransferase [Intrasporangium oryzae NRRL B-24470]|uniref:Acyltransferase n=1 Tax=Intrasporangium oryzae NRRL B-24470 TaxID=1386089 RepID=W9GGH6_9MICO|nr:acyltransferase [Intrasporangium oryzae]EWT02969.1 acyltransferase [Intrasporangium oryzae NRRL B-24470]
MQHSRNRDLDGVRGLAVLLVVAAHAGLPVRWGGLSGVTLFFVLSGYLITSLLVREHDRYGAISLWRFWGRRALRLLPALLLLLAAVPVLLALTDPGHLAAYPWQALASLLYVGNYVRIAGHDLGVLNHLWSLSVEEQFYVVWPTVFVVVVTWFRARALSIVLALAGGATFYSVWTKGAAIRLDVATETNAFALLLGASLALALAELGRREIALPHASPLFPFLVLVALSAFPGHSMEVDHELFRPLGAVFAVVALWLVYAAVSGHARLVGSRFMVFFGTISYAFYLWHQALINSRLLGAHTLGRNLVLVAVAVVVAWLSWVLVERPTGRLRSRLRLDEPSGRQAAALAARAQAQAQATAGTGMRSAAPAASP